MREFPHALEYSTTLNIVNKASPNGVISVIHMQNDFMGKSFSHFVPKHSGYVCVYTICMYVCMYSNMVKLIETETTDECLVKN